MYSSIWKRIKVLLASLILFLKLRSSVKKAVVFLAVIFSIVTQRSSKVEANQNTAFDKRIVSKQKRKRAKPFGWTWAFNFYWLIPKILAIILKCWQRTVWVRLQNQRKMAFRHLNLTYGKSFDGLGKSKNLSKTAWCIFNPVLLPWNKLFRGFC